MCAAVREQAIMCTQLISCFNSHCCRAKGSLTQWSHAHQTESAHTPNTSKARKRAKSE